jgi:predicted NBD/HSP70 family sugar kinase
MSIIGLDIGGTKIKGILVDDSGKIIYSKKIFIEDLNHKQIISELTYIIKFLIGISKQKVQAIGISICGIVQEGKLISTGVGLNDLKGKNLKKIIQTKFNLPVIIENDANCFALAESVKGKYSKYTNLVGVIWGTGVGSGIIINQEIYSGSKGGAGEIGKLKVPILIDSQTKQSYNIEHLCGGKYMKKSYGKNILPSKIFDLKDVVAKKISQIALSAMAWSIANLINTLNPNVIVLGGGMSNISKTTYTKLKKEVKKYCMPELFSSTKIYKYSISDDAGALGAVILAKKLNQ